MTTDGPHLATNLASAQPLAIILARAGSKGVPGKNVSPVAGRPCIAWTIDHVRASALLARAIVSTDGRTIADTAKSLGIDVIDRPAHLATDLTTVDEAVRHAVLKIEDEDGRSDPQRPIVILYANVPVRPEGLIDRAIERLRISRADSVQSYAPVGKMHPWWMARVNADTGAVQPWEGDLLNHGVFRRQDLPPAHVPDGGVLVVTRRALFLGVPNVPPGPHAFFGAHRAGLINPEGSVIDIDSPIDLLVADAILRSRATAPA